MHHGSLLTGKLQNEDCRGRADALCDPYSSLGHLLNEATSEGEPVVWCMRCGHWTSNRIRNLGSACQRVANQEGLANLKRINGGEHPKFSLVRRVMDGKGAALDQTEDAALLLSRHAATVRRLADRQDRSFGNAWAEHPALPRGTRVDVADLDEYPDGPDDEDFYGTAAEQDAIDAMFLDDPFGHGFFPEVEEPGRAHVVNPEGGSAPAAVAAGISEAQRESIQAKKAKALEAKKTRKEAEAAQKIDNDKKKAERIMKIPRKKRSMAQLKLTYDVLGDAALELPPSDVEGDESEEERRKHVKSWRAKRASTAAPTVSSSGASSSNAPAPPSAAAEVVQPPPGTTATANAESVAKPPPPCPRVRGSRPAAAAPAGLFGFVAKALGVSTVLKLPAANAACSAKPVQPNEVEVVSDDSEDSPRGPGQVPEEWADSFRTFQSLQSCTPPAVESPAVAQAGEQVPVVDSDVSSTNLRELVDLVADGVAVRWPPGLDVRTANAALLARSAVHPETAVELRPRADAKPKAPTATAAERLAALRERRSLPSAPAPRQPTPAAASPSAKSKQCRSAKGDLGSSDS